MIKTNNTKLGLQAGIELGENGTKVHFPSFALFIRECYILFLCAKINIYIFSKAQQSAVKCMKRSQDITSVKKSVIST